MSGLTAKHWEDYYASPNRFAQIFNDYATLKETKRTTEQNVKYKVVCDIIDGKFCV